MAVPSYASPSTLPASGGAILSTPLANRLTGLNTFLNESGNIDEANVDLTSADGLVGKSTAQTIAGFKTFQNPAAAAGGLLEVAEFNLNPISGTATDADGIRLVFSGDMDNGSPLDYGYIDLTFDDTGSASADSTWSFKRRVNGSIVAQAFADLSSSNTWTGTNLFSNTVTVGVNDTGYDVKFFGAAAGAFSLWDESENKLTIQGATAAGAGSLLLSTGELTNVDGGILGRIDFAAPLDNAGSDSRLAGASIWAEADDTFSASLNDTDLVFAVAESEAALERMRLSYDGTNVGLLFSGATTIGAGGALITFNGAITSDGAVTGTTLAGTVSTATQNSITAATSLASVGTITSGTWQSTAVASAYLDADTAHLGVTQTFTGAKTFTNTVTVGVDDAGYDVKLFGNAAGAYMEWDASADQLRIMGASADAATSTGKLLLATSLTNINANDVLGKIDFQAPHEAGGTDAIAIAASIQAVAQGTFAANVNATDLIFYTGHAEPATEKFRMTSQGEIGIGGANYGTDGHVLTSAGAGAAVAWEALPSGAVTAGDDLAWSSGVESGTDENAQRIIFVDLDDPLQLWDYAEFMQQIQSTSWHDELGDPPVHGLMYINEAQDDVIWYNRETKSIYMQFNTDSSDMLGSGTLADIAFQDGVIYVAQSDGVYYVDLVRDSGYSHTTTAYNQYAGNVTARNSGSGVQLISSASTHEIKNNTVTGVATVRDPSLTDEFNRPKHWWVAGTAGGQSVYSPVADAIYDQGTGNNLLTDISMSGELMQGVNATNDWWQVRDTIFGVSADSYGYNYYWASGDHIPWTSQILSDSVFLEGASFAEEGSSQLWVGSDKGIIVGHLHTKEAAEVSSIAGSVILHEDYASPYMKGDVRQCYSLHSTADVSGGTAHTLTNNNSVTFHSGGPAGSYADFVAASSMSLSAADHADFGAFTELSVCCWIYRDIDSGGIEYLVSHYDVSSGTNDYLMRIMADDTITWQLDTGGTADAISTGTISTGKWYYLAGTYDGVTQKIYINGVVSGSVAAAGTTDGSAEVFAIGCAMNSGTAQQFFDGKIGGVVVTGTAMTEREIKAEYQRGLRRINSTIDTNDTISDNDVAALAADPHGKYVAVLGDDKVCRIFNEFAVPVATDTSAAATVRDIAIKSMSGGVDPHYVMAGSDQVEIVQPNIRIGV